MFDPESQQVQRYFDSDQDDDSSQGMDTDLEAASTNYQAESNPVPRFRRKKKKVNDVPDDVSSVLGARTLASLMSTRKSVVPDDSDDDDEEDSEHGSSVGPPEFSPRSFKTTSSNGTPDPSTRDGEDGDSDTCPETPPPQGGLRVLSLVEGTDSSLVKDHEQKPKGANSPTSAGSENSTSKGSSSMGEGPSRRVFYSAAVLGLLLLAAIAGMTFLLSHLRKDDPEEATTAVEDRGGAESWGEWTSESGPSGSIPKNVPTDAPTDAPTDVPTEFPTASPTLSAGDSLWKLLLDDHQIDLAAFSPDAPQYRSWEWIAQDPNFFNYDEGKILQRYTLGVLAYGFSSSTAGAEERRRLSLPPMLQDSWLQYGTDECSWFSTKRSGSVCNNQGWYTHIDLRELNLSGSLPPELRLLSGSLKTILLDKNHIHGTIPVELGELGKLERVQLTLNSLDGPIPSQIGLLKELTMLELGHNGLNGTIPLEMGNMEELVTLRLDSNQLVGSIPPEFGKLGNLLHLDLESNQLTDTIPSELGNITGLERLRVNLNMISGEVPLEVCSLSNMTDIFTDCGEVECSCCETCFSTPSPTQTPSADPSLAPTVTFAPSPLASTPPTLFPTTTPTALPPTPPTAFPTTTPTSVPTTTPTSSPTTTPLGPPATISEVSLTSLPTSTPLTPRLLPTAVPTTSPTPFPTESPTTSQPSSSPTECVDSIEVTNTNTDCMARGESIEVSFRNCNPQPDDLIGLYYRNANQDNLGGAILWVSTCGDQVCEGNVSSGSVVLDLTSIGVHKNSVWPLKASRYRVFLARGNPGGPHTAIAGSGEVRVRQNTGWCS